jgi:L-ascorbate metabolism protein UlaG (beta-lactamase superfamily)
MKMRKSFAILNTMIVIGALVLLASVFAQTPQATDDALPTTNGNATIHPIGHASVQVTWNGKKILVDPAPNGGGGRGAAGAGGAAGGGRGGGGRGGGRGAGRGAGGAAPPPSAEVLAVFTSLGQADLILITHAHGDHFNAALLSAVAGPKTVLGVPQAVYDALPEPLKAKATIMANGDDSTLAGVDVQAVPAYNVTPERLRNHPEGTGNGYVLDLGGKRVYFAGDTEETPELKNLANIDVAFLPMNLPFTQTPEAAAQWVKDFKPKVVYPYHFSNGDLSAFVSAVGSTAEVRMRKWY